MIKNIGIIGEGKMGTNLLYYLIDMDFNLTWICSTNADLEKLHRNFDKRLTRTLDAGIINENRFQDIQDRIKISDNLVDSSSCDLIVEAIHEDLSAKQQLFHSLDEIVDPACILTSNSSSIKPSSLVPSENRKARFAGLHFFYPIALKDIVEVIITPETSDDTIEKITTFLKTICRQHLLLKEQDAFILNRIFLHFQNEAFLMVKEKNASMLQIDRIVKDKLFPTGVFEFFDSVGLDIMLASVKNYSAGDPEEERFYPLISELNEHVSNGRLGTKTKSGFYTSEFAIDPGFPEKDNDILKRLQASYSLAFQRYCRLSSIPAKELKTAMDEYFGVETPEVG